MNIALKHLSYPYITSNAAISGGAPIIEGTRITVRCIAGYYQMGMMIDEIISALGHLTPSQVHSALAYYFDHQEEINLDLAEAIDEASWKGRILSHPARKSPTE